ncbi:MAG: hypothetical protein KF760_28825 [Candidatus Eremiobacteraeota bacterium]|nr:hypothetical protein [Candidatus Eremiobacteraeota bacterium]MCW5865902.1 hypothetical protein [Candidatus Eremiobacteraeota bacterium]
MNPIQNSPVQSMLNSPALASPVSTNQALPEIVDTADKEEVSQVPSNISELRRAHPWLNPAQLGNLMLNQTGQQATYHQVQALRPSYQNGHFNRLGGA